MCQHNIDDSSDIGSIKNVEIFHPEFVAGFFEIVITIQGNEYNY